MPPGEERSAERTRKGTGSMIGAAAEARRSERWGRSAAALTMAAWLLGTAPAVVLAQTPAAPTPPAQAALPSSEFAAGAPHLQTIAQGLVNLSGPVVWRVREISLAPSGAVESGGFSFTLQRSGAAIIRNELTSRRARLEPGEAYFMSSDDPYSRSAVGLDPSIVWIVDLAPVDAPSPAGTVLFTSPPIADYPQGTFDAELKRDVLLTGEVTELPAHTGPALVMVTAGRVEATPEGGAPTQIGAGSGLLATGRLTLRNADTQPAAYVVAGIGDPAEGAEGAGPAPVTALNPTPASLPTPTPAPPVEVPQPAPAEPTPAPTSAVFISESGDADGDGLSDIDEANYGSDPLNADYDGDGLGDGDEVYRFGTDPLTNDTDGDSLLDGEEINTFGTNPATPDSDGDGLGDADEIYVYTTLPTAFDSDGDGFGDGDEINVYGTLALDPNSRP